MSRGGIILFILNLNIRWSWVINFKPPWLYHRECVFVYTYITRVRTQYRFPYVVLRRLQDDFKGYGHLQGFIMKQVIILLKAMLLVSRRAQRHLCSPLKYSMCSVCGTIHIESLFCFVSVVATKENSSKNNVLFFPLTCWKFLALAEQKLYYWYNTTKKITDKNCIWSLQQKRNGTHSLMNIIQLFRKVATLWK